MGGYFFVRSKMFKGDAPLNIKKEEIIGAETQTINPIINII